MKKPNKKPTFKQTLALAAILFCAAFVLVKIYERDYLDDRTFLPTRVKAFPGEH